MTLLRSIRSTCCRSPFVPTLTKTSSTCGCQKDGFCIISGFNSSMDVVVAKVAGVMLLFQCLWAQQQVHGWNRFKHWWCIATKQCWGNLKMKSDSWCSVLIAKMKGWVKCARRETVGLTPTNWKTQGWLHSAPDQNILKTIFMLRETEKWLKDGGFETEYVSGVKWQTFLSSQRFLKHSQYNRSKSTLGLLFNA